MQKLAISLQPIARRLPLPAGVIAFVVLALLAVASLTAQVSGDRGIPPVASSTDIEVRGIEVNTTGDSPEEARENGWREAQKLAWKKIDGPDIPDSRLQSLVSAIVVEEEQLGPRRYVARLGVIFDRSRAGALLGADGERARSAPMLTLPVMISGGTETMFEVRNPWQRAWAEYQFGSSSIDYVRPSGQGGESLLLTYGQTSRRSRIWWNNVLDQFGAADVLVPIADLHWKWPGGPVEGKFVARFGPDNRYLGSFTMKAESPAQLPRMLTAAVAKFDAIFARALADGKLAPDPTLSLGNVEVSPAIRELLNQARAAEAAEAAARARRAAAAARNDAAQPGVEPGEEPSAQPGATTPAVGNYNVQVTTADTAAFDAALSAVRGAPGVNTVAVASTAIGGTSVLRVNYSGDLSALAGALRARGWRVTEGAGALAIAR